jgi:D-arginine dehydrogenase
MGHYDFLVVGGGIAGASIAYELRGCGRVGLLEQEEACGYHTTGRSAALFVRTYGNEIVQALTSASLAFFDALPRDFSDRALLKTCGCLYVGRDDQRGQLQQLAETGARTGAAISCLDAKEVARRVPILKPHYVAGVFEPEAASIDVDGLHQGYLRALRRSGAHVLNAARVEEIWPTSHGLSLHVGTQKLFAKTVINAAGAWADHLAHMAGARTLSLSPLRRTAILVDPPPALDVGFWPMVVDADEQFYFKPEAGKLLASPCNEDPSPPCDAQADELDIAVCVDRLETATTLAITRVTRSWAGLRTFAPDRTPVVGFDPEIQGLFWFAGQGGFGLQTAPALAQLGAALARQEPVPDLIARLGVTAQHVSPHRFC